MSNLDELEVKNRTAEDYLSRGEIQALIDELRAYRDGEKLSDNVTGLN